jgi:plasmid stabilization system protein ParE
MPRHKIIYSPTAEVCIKSIFEYIAADNLYYAEKVISSIDASLLRLSEFPYLGTKVDAEVRCMTEPHYRYKIYYTIE